MKVGEKPFKFLASNELVCRVFLKPTKTAEFVELNFILVSTGGNFTEILGNP